MDFELVRSHGIGNDYLVFDPQRTGCSLNAAQVRLLCDRHQGVGSDGVLMLTPSESCDFGLRIFNPDGSEAEKSGNGLRIFSKFLFDYEYTSKRQFSIDTAGGRVSVEVFGDQGRADRVRVEMGAATINKNLSTLDIDGQRIDITAISVGNPHAVVLVPDLEKVDLRGWGPRIETHPAFPNRTNVQFAEVVTRKEIRVLVWERGAGHTISSGSSACAAAYACYFHGLVDDVLTVHLEGGDLKIEIRSGNQLVMTGPVEEIGRIRLSDQFKQHLLSI